MNVLFVCSGNVFRSMSADYCLRDYLEKNGIKGVNVSSAGTHFHDDRVEQNVMDELKALGIDASNHHRRNINKEILEENDLIVSMAGYHQVFLKEGFGVESILFNKICYDVNKSIPDNWEHVGDLDTHKQENEIYEKGVVDFIHDSIPNFVKNMNKFVEN